MRIFGFGVGSSECIFVPDEDGKFILTLDSAKVVVFSHVAKSVSGDGSRCSVVPCFSRLVPQVLYGFQPERGTAQASGSPTCPSVKLLKEQGQARVTGFANKQVVVVVALNPLVPDQ